MPDCPVPGARRSSKWAVTSRWPGYGLRMNTGTHGFNCNGFGSHGCQTVLCPARAARLNGLHPADGRDTGSGFPSPRAASTAMASMQSVPNRPRPAFPMHARLALRAACAGPRRAPDALQPLAGSCIKACAKASARRAKRRKNGEEAYIMQPEYAPNTNFAIYFTKRREMHLHCRAKVIYNLLKARGGRRHPERRDMCDINGRDRPLI